MAIAALLDLARSLHDATTLAEAMDQVLVAVCEHTRYRRAWLGLPLPTGGLEIIGYAVPDKPMVAARMAAVDVERDAYLQAALTATAPFVIPDLRLDPRADQAQVAFFGNRTVVVVPMLKLGGERIGALTVGTFAAEGVMVPTDVELEFIVQIAAVVSAAAARIRVEEEQRRLAEQLRAAQRLEALGRLAGEVAHDFNNLLTAISVNAELLRGVTDPARIAGGLDEINAAADRAAELTRQLLAFSRGQPRQPRPLVVDQVLTGFLPLVTRLLPARIALDVALDADLPVVGDAGQLEQVVMNLITNARDAVVGTGRIALSTRVVDRAPGGAEPGRHVVIAVTDSGPGMPDEVRARVFEPFFTTKRLGSGTGLGLAVVDSIVRQHRGVVDVTSAPGAGTTFEVYLPAQAAAVAASTAPAASSAVRRATGARVLVVDDDAAVRRLVERILVAAGYQVTSAADAESALAMLPTLGPVALVVSDVVLPGLDGVALARRVAALPGAPPVLLMSGYAPETLSLGELAVMTKPFSRADLLVRVDALIGARAA